MLSPQRSPTFVAFLHTCLKVLSVLAVAFYFINGFGSMLEGEAGFL